MWQMLDMHPELFPNNAANMRAVYMKQSRKFGLVNTDDMKSANVQYLFGGQFRLAVRLAFNCAAPCGSVAVIIFRCSLKQVGRIAALRPIARMANVASGPTSIRKVKTNSMRTVTASHATMAGTEVAISSMGAFSPFPALTLRAVSARLVDAVPKTFDVLFGKLRRVYINNSHSDLLFRLRWLGSFGGRTSFEPSYFTTVG